MSTFATADLCDTHEAHMLTGALQVLEPGLQSYGGRRTFCGPCVTLKLFEDNSLLATAVQEPGQGRVLVVDAGGSLRCAVLGGNLGSAARVQGWLGVVIYGAVRDTEELAALDIGVLALASTPPRSIKRGTGERDLPLFFLGTRFVPGFWIYADPDGMVVSSTALIQH